MMMEKSWIIALWKYPYIKKSEVKSLYQGHEIACHSCSHITMTRGNSIQNINEIIDNRIALENICDTLVTGYSYPNGCYDQTSKEILRSCGIKYARTTKSTYKFELPQDFLEWHPTCHHNEDIFAFLDKFLGIHHAERLNVFYLWGHSYEFERDQTWNQIETFFQKATGHKNVWYLCVYIKWRKHISDSIWTNDTIRLGDILTFFLAHVTLHMA